MGSSEMARVLLLVMSSVVMVVCYFYALYKGSVLSYAYWKKGKKGWVAVIVLTLILLTAFNVFVVVNCAGHLNSIPEQSAHH